MKIAIWKGICPHIIYSKHGQPWPYQDPNIGNQANNRPRPLKIQSTSELTFNILQSTLENRVNQYLHSTTEMPSSSAPISTISVYKLNIVSEPPSERFHPTAPQKPSKVASKLDLMLAIKGRWCKFTHKEKWKSFRFIKIHFWVGGEKVFSSNQVRVHKKVEKTRLV